MKQAVVPIIPRNVPPGWEIIRFTDAFTDRTGGQKKIKKREYLPTGDLPVVDQGLAPIGGHTDDPNARCNVPLPCLLFGDHTKVIKYCDFPFALGADGVKLLEPRADIDARFAFHYLSVLPLPTDAGYSRHFKFLKRTWFPLPPFPEQRRIAVILDKADAVRRKRQQTLDLADQFLRSAFLDMFGDPVTNPKRWPTCRLEELVREGDRINYGVVQPGPHVEGGVPIVRVGDFHRGGIEKTGMKRISRDIETSYVRSRLRGNEILVSCVGSIGQIAIAEAEMRGWNIVRAVARAHLSDFVDTAYIAEYLRTSYVQSYFRSETRTVSQPTLNIKQIRSTPVLLPPIGEQRGFANLVCEFSAQRVRLSATESFAGTLQTSLVQRAFRGELSASGRGKP